MLVFGSSRAAQLILSGRSVSSDEALSLGLVDAVLPDDDFLAATLEWVAPIAHAPRHTVAAAKRAIVDGLELRLQAGLDNEQRIFRATLASQESRTLFEAADGHDASA